MRPSYDPCEAGDLCGLMTRCTAVPLGRVAGDAATLLCTAACRRDDDCPGFDARCIAGPDSSALCFRGCRSSLDCRDGTACHPLPRDGGVVGICVPDDGRGRCAGDSDCAPFAEVCGRPDAGTGRDAALGTCRPPDAASDGP